MITKEEAPKHTVKDLYLAAAQMLANNMAKMKGKDLTEKEQEAVQNIAKVISKGVLKDMGVI